MTSEAPILMSHYAPLPHEPMGPGPIASALGKHRQGVSLLTSALGDRPMPIHPFLSSNSPAAIGAMSSGAAVQGDAQLEQVLTTWDKAWMGPVVATTSSHPSSSTGTPSQQLSPRHQAAHSPNGTSSLPIPLAATSTSAVPIAASSLSKVGSSPPIVRDSPVPPLPATPPPAHRPLGLTTQPTDESDDASLDGRAHVKQHTDANGISGTSPSQALPISMHQPSIPKNAKNANDFASVFFSPLPYSYLNMARSDSTDQALHNSVGSPDITLRGGRLAASTSITHVEWPVEADLSPGLSTLAALDDTPMTAVPGLTDATPGTTAREDVTTHGLKRRSPSSNSNLSYSAAQTSSALSLVQQTLAHARMQEKEDEDASAELAKANEANTSVSPDSILADPDSNGNQSPLTASCSTTPAPATSNGNRTTVKNISLLGTSSGHEPSIIIRPGPPRPGSPSPPPFSAHPAVASVMQPVIPGLPVPTDHLQGTGYQSIAAVLQTQTQSVQSLRLVAAAAMIPHVDKADKGGEDAYCIVDSGLGSIGVADGVSGWAEEGIDPAEYSRTLMQYCSDALQEAGVSADAREVIRYAHKSTVMPGSSTVCLALMKPAGRLQIANLGDSGVRIIRDGHIIFASAAQQHMFNMPFQLSHPSIIDSPDDADSADVTVVDVVPGDVIIMATDGLYDNMFDDEIAAICHDVISRRKRLLMLGACGDAAPAAEDTAKTAASINSQLYTQSEAEALAVQITRTAHKYAQNPYQRTPWSVASCEQGYGWARYFAKGGGKMDDCTVIVSFVQPDAPSPSSKPNTEGR